MSSVSRRSSRSPSTSPTPASCERFVDQVVETFGGIDILFNNAGLALGRDPVWSSDPEDERGVMETNVIALMRMTRLCVPYLEADGGGHIVNMGSVAGVWSYPSGGSIRRLEVRRARLHACAPRRSSGQAGSRHEHRAGNGRDRVLEGALPRRRGEGRSGLFERSRWAGALTAEDVADCIMFALTRPPHVNIDEILLMALAQTSGANILRTS